MTAHQQEQRETASAWLLRVGPLARKLNAESLNDSTARVGSRAQKGPDGSNVVRS